MGESGHRQFRFILSFYPVPGVSLRLAFNEMDKDQCFFLFNKKDKDLVELFRRNNTGGPALVMIITVFKIMLMITQINTFYFEFF